MKSRMTANLNYPLSEEETKVEPVEQKRIPIDLQLLLWHDSKKLNVDEAISVI